MMMMSQVVAGHRYGEIVQRSVGAWQSLVLKRVVVWLPEVASWLVHLVVEV
jgi:hypothetical protein